MHPANQVVLDAVAAVGITPRMVWLDEHARAAVLAAEQAARSRPSKQPGLRPRRRAAAGHGQRRGQGGHRAHRTYPRGRAGPAGDASFVREATGQAIGGVAPTGHPTRLHTLVDVDLEAFEEVWAAGGTPDTVMPLRYAELLHLTGGTPAPVR